MKTLFSLKTVLGVFFFFTLPLILMGNSWLYVAGTTIVSLPQPGSMVLDINPNVSASINAGSPVDGDAVGTIVDQAQSKSYTQATSSKKPTYKTNILNGKPILRFDSSNDQKLTESATTLVATNTPFTILAVSKISSYTTPYRYLFGFKAALAGNAPTWGYSTNGSFADGFFGADSGWMVFRVTSITTTSWNSQIITYDGTGGSTIGHYAAYAASAGTSLTLTSTSSNNGDTVNVLGSYLSGTTTHSFNGDLARFVVWNVKLGSTDLATTNTFVNQQYGL